MNPEKEFFTKVTALAAMCGFTMTPEIIALYDRYLSPLGYDKLSEALDEIIASRKSRDPFPSIREMRAIVMPELDPEFEAIDAAGRIVQAISRIGPYQHARAKEFVGELGWAVVEREGGWQTVCQILTDDNVGILKAQWRQMAKAQHARLKAGIANAPKLPARDEMGTLIPFEIGKLLQEIPK